MKNMLKIKINKMKDKHTAEKFTLITKLAKKISKRLRKNDVKDPDSVVGFRMTVVSSIIADRAFDYYEEKDGEIYDYIYWFINSSASMVRNEYMYGIKDGVNADPSNFFIKLCDAYRENNGDCRKAAKKLHIQCNRKLMKKTIEVCKEFELCR